jgi:hypothetical protein
VLPRQSESRPQRPNGRRYRATTGQRSALLPLSLLAAHTAFGDGPGSRFDFCLILPRAPQRLNRQQEGSGRHQFPVPNISARSAAALFSDDPGKLALTLLLLLSRPGPLSAVRIASSPKDPVIATSPAYHDHRLSGFLMNLSDVTDHAGKHQYVGSSPDSRSTTSRKCLLMRHFVGDLLTCVGPFNAGPLEAGRRAMRPLTRIGLGYSC